MGQNLNAFEFQDAASEYSLFKRSLFYLEQDFPSIETEHRTEADLPAQYYYGN